LLSFKLPHNGLGIAAGGAFRELRLNDDILYNSIAAVEPIEISPTCGNTMLADVGVLPASTAVFPIVVRVDEIASYTSYKETAKDQTHS